MQDDTLVKLAPNEPDLHFARGPSRHENAPLLDIDGDFTQEGRVSKPRRGIARLNAPLLKNVLQALPKFWVPAALVQEYQNEKYSVIFQHRLASCSNASALITAL